MNLNRPLEVVDAGTDTLRDFLEEPKLLPLEQTVGTPIRRCVKRHA